MALGNIFKKKKKVKEEEDMFGPAGSAEPKGETPYGPQLSRSEEDDEGGGLPPLPGIEKGPELPRSEPPEPEPMEEPEPEPTPLKTPVEPERRPAREALEKVAEPVEPAQQQALQGGMDQKIEMLNLKIDAIRSQVENMDNKLSFIQRYIMGGAR